MELRPKGEGSAFSLEFGFQNYLGQPTVMLDVKYRIDCLTTRRTVRDWTSVTPAQTMSIEVAPSDNEIFVDSNRRERRQITIVANDDNAAQFVDPDPVTWYVNNTLPGRSVVP